MMVAVAVEDYLPLVAMVAKRYRRNRCLSFDDLVQEGCFGLMHAAQRFDYSRGYKFTTFAVPAIRWFIHKALAKCRPPHANLLNGEDGQGVPMPAHPGPEPEAKVEAKEEVAALLRRLPARERKVVEMRFGLLDGRDMPVKEIARRMGTSRQWIESILKRCLTQMSRNAKQHQLSMPASKAL